MPDETNEVMAPEPEIEVVDEFGDAFKDATEATKETNAPDLAVKEEQVVSDEKVDTKEALQAEPKEIVPEKVEPKSDEQTWEQRYRSLQGMFNKQAEELKSIKTSPVEPPKESPAKDAPPEEDEEIKEFLTEFDYLAKPIQKIVEKLVSQKTGEVEAKADAKVQATHRMVADLVITAQHPDFFELRESGEIRKWVDTKTGQDKEFYTRVCNEGSISDIINLISDYKKATKKETPDLQKQQERQEKLTNLSAVKNKPGIINAHGGGKPDDFNGAFAKRAAEYERRR